MPRVLLHTACILALISGACSSKEPILAERRLPPDVVYFLSVRNVPALKVRVQESLVGRMLADPKFWACCDQFTGIDTRKGLSYSFTLQLQSLEERLDPPLAEIWQCFQGEATCAMLRDPSGEVSIVTFVDVGDRAHDVFLRRHSIAQGLVEDAGPLKEQDIRGTPCLLIEPSAAAMRRKRKADRRPLDVAALCVKDSTLVFATSDLAMEAVLERWAGDHPQTFAASPEFHRIHESCREGLPHVDVAWFYLRDAPGKHALIEAAAGVTFSFLMTPLVLLSQTDVPNVVGADESAEDYELPVSCVGGVLSIAAGDYDFVARSAARIHSDAADTDAAEAIALRTGLIESTPRNPPAWIPADAFRVWNWRWKPGRVAGDVSVSGSFSRLDELPSAATSLCRMLGDSLTGQVWYVDLRPSNGRVEWWQPTMVLAMEAADAASLERTIADLVKQEKLTSVDSPHGKTWKVALPRRGSWHMAIRDGAVFLAEELDPLERALKPAATRLADAKAYQSLAACRPESCLFSQYFNLSPAHLTYCAEMMLTEADAADPQEPRKAPDAELLNRLIEYLPPIAGVAELHQGVLRMSVFRLREH